MAPVAFVLLHFLNIVTPTDINQSDEIPYYSVYSDDNGYERYISTPTHISISDDTSSPGQTTGNSRHSPDMTSPVFSMPSLIQSPMSSIVEAHTTKFNDSRDARHEQSNKIETKAITTADSNPVKCHEDIMGYYKSRIRSFQKFTEFSKMGPFMKKMMQQNIKPNVAVWNEFFVVWMSPKNTDNAVDTKFWRFLNAMHESESPPTVETFNVILMGLAMHRKGELMDYVIEMMPGHRVIPDGRSYAIACLMGIHLQNVNYLQVTDALLYIQNRHRLTGGHFIIKNFISLLANATVEDYNQIIGQTQITNLVFVLFS